MKKLLLLFVMCLGSLGAYSQMQYLIEGGVSYTTMTTDDSNYRIGGRLGVGFDVPLGDYITFQPMLELSMKGHKEEVRSEKFDTLESVKSNPVYLVLPLKLSYSFPIESNLDWRINAGPYIAYGVFGKYKREHFNEFGENEGEIEEDLFGSDGRFSQFEVGLAAGTKFIFTPFYITLDAEWGLINLNRDDGRRALKSIAYSAGFGFIF